MKRTNKKGFTIVELVIVIAVIAILAAVLIPTFSNLINKANQSNDTMLCKNINTALAYRETVDGKPATPSQAIVNLDEDGFALVNLSPTSTGAHIVYDQSQNRVALFDAEFNLVYSNTTPSSNPSDLWAIVGDQTAVDSVVAKGWSYLITTDQQLTVTNSFDSCLVGESANVTLEGQGGNSYNVYANGGNVILDGASDSFYLNGTLTNVSAWTANDSLHLNGTIQALTLHQGHVKIAEGSKIESFIPNPKTDVNILYVTDDNANDTGVGSYAFDKNSTVVVRNVVTLETTAPEATDYYDVSFTTGSSEVQVAINSTTLTEEQISSLKNTIADCSAIVTPSQDGDGTQGFGTIANPFLIDSANWKSILDSVTKGSLQLVEDINFTEAFVVSNKNITLDLNGHILRNGDLTNTTLTVERNGVLKIIDSSADKNGAVYSNVLGKAAIVNLGTVIIDGGYYGSEQNTQHYAIKNYGTMIINEAHVENTADNTSTASLIRNGCTDGTDTGSAETGTLIINGGLFETTNGSNVLKSEKGLVEINDGHLIMHGPASDSGVIQTEAKLVINGGTIEHANVKLCDGLIWTITGSANVHIELNGGLYKVVSNSDSLIYPNATKRQNVTVIINKAESIGGVIPNNTDIASTSVWLNAQRADEYVSHTIVVPASELGSVVEMENGTAGIYFADTDYYNEPKPISSNASLVFYVYKSYDIEHTVTLTTNVGTISFYLAEGADIDKLTYVPYSEDYLLTITESTNNLPEPRLGKTFVKCITVKYEVNPNTAIMKVVNADGSIVGYYMSQLEASKAVTDTVNQKIIMQQDLDNSAGGYSWSYSCAVDMGGRSIIAGSTYAISISSSSKTLIFNNGTLQTRGANENVIIISGSSTTITANNCTIIGDKITLTKGSLTLNSSTVSPVTEEGTVIVTLGNVASSFTVKDTNFNGTVISDVVGYDVITTENTDGSITYSLKAGEYVELIREGATVGIYATLADALSAASAGDTLKVIKDIDQLGKYPSISKSITIDLNGHTIRGKSTTAVVLVSAASVTLTIIDSSEAQTGAIINYCTTTTSTYNSISSSQKNVVLNIEGGIYSKINLTQTTATLNISGTVNMVELSNKGVTKVLEGIYNFDVNGYVDEAFYTWSRSEDGIYTVTKK